MRPQPTNAPVTGMPRASEAVDMDLLRAISWGDGPDLPADVPHLDSWRLIRAGLAARTPKGLVVTSHGLRVLDEDDF